VKVAVSYTDKQWVAIVEPWADNAAGDDSGNIIRQGLAHMAQRAYVEVAGLTHVGHMLVECKMPV